MNKIVKIIGVGGFARSGKDTFVGISKKILEKNNYRAVRVGFADILKTELQEMLKSNRFTGDVYSDDSDEKNKIRPLMVWWGCQRRFESVGGLYWVNMVNDHIQSIVRDHLKNGESIDSLVILISDVRFANEAKWIIDEYGGVVIHLKRYIKKASEKVYDVAPNDEEAYNDPFIIEYATQNIDWENKGKMTVSEAAERSYLKDIVFKSLNETKFFNGKLTL